jgi:hypothetical protein
LKGSTSITIGGAVNLLTSSPVTFMLHFDLLLIVSKFNLVSGGIASAFFWPQNYTGKCALLKSCLATFLFTVHVFSLL